MSDMDNTRIEEAQICDEELYTRSSDGTTLIDNSKLLIQAVKQGNETLVVKLLNAGIPSYISDQLGCNPFFYAARYNHINIIKILLKSGVLINVITKMGRTALQIAAYHGHIECVKFLLDNDANVDLVDSLGMSALHWACENDHPECVKLLLKAGANVGLVNKFGKTALTLALRKNQFEICAMLREHADQASKRSEFILSEDLLSLGDKYKPFTALFIPDKNSLFSNQKVAISRPVTRESKVDGDRSSSAFKTSLKKADTIKLFEQHGIRLLPVDQSTIIASALKRGQTAVLTEAGKLALKKTEPNIIRKIASMSNTPPPAKKLRVKDENKDNCLTENSKSTAVVAKIDNVDAAALNKTKIIKIDAKQLVNLTANKKLIISRQKQLNSSDNEVITQTENPTSNSTQRSNNGLVKELENQLKKKTSLLQDVKKQLDFSLKLAKDYKSRLEVKEREAALYKTQLINLSKLLMKSGIKIGAVKEWRRELVSGGDEN